MSFNRSVAYESFQAAVNAAFTELKLDGCKDICAYVYYDGLEVTGHRTESVEEFNERYGEALFKRAQRLAAREYMGEKVANDEKRERAKKQKLKEVQFKELAQEFGNEKAGKLLQNALSNKKRKKK